jgi:hypothetical protein
MCASQRRARRATHSGVAGDAVYVTLVSGAAHVLLGVKTADCAHPDG